LYTNKAGDGAILLRPFIVIGQPCYNNYDNIDINYKEGGMGLRYKGNIHAPEFPKGLDWINVPRPLTMADLRGKIVLLEFHTFG
jgi:hypothetical protein